MDLHEHLARARAMRKEKTEEEKRAHSAMMNAKRWAGHVKKSPKTERDTPTEKV